MIYELYLQIVCFSLQKYHFPMQQAREYGLQDFVGGDFGGDFADCVGVGA